MRFSLEKSVKYRRCAFPALTSSPGWPTAHLPRRHVGLIRDHGTANEEATAASANRLNEIQDSKSRIIILLTDGDNNKGEIDPVPAAQLAAALGEKVYTIGIGSEAPCQLPKFDPSTGKLALDAAGKWIPTTLALRPANYAVLGKMAA